MWTIWWAWLGFALVLGILEILAPAFVLLGFALGAAAVGVLFLVGGPLATFLAASLPVTLAVFAVLSLVAWVILRRVMGVREGQVKIWHRDINDD